MDSDDSGDEILRRLDELERTFREKQMEAIREGDHLGTAYLSGKIFALLDAQDVVEEVRDGTL